MKKVIMTDVMNPDQIMREFMMKRYPLDEEYESIETLSLVNLSGSEWVGVYRYVLRPTFYSWVHHLIPKTVMDSILCIENRSVFDLKARQMRFSLDTIDAPYFHMDVSIEFPDTTRVIITIHEFGVKFHNVSIPSFIVSGIRNRTLKQIEKDLLKILTLCKN